MKKLLANIIIMLMAAGNLTAQTIISGVVTDGNEPLVGANVYILGTIDGCLTDSLGHFSFSSGKTGEVTLKTSFIGYDDCIMTDNIEKMTHLIIRMKERASTIDEIVVTASTFHFGKGDGFQTMDALDVVMAGNSCGDIVAALQTLPGTQKVGENGKLYVRGGDSEECQTFVNGMHVLIPYSTHTENSAVRGRFSPFMFKGINFSLGGYSGEYGQALSSVLPMETTDVATGDKLGVSASLVDWNVGGTKSYTHSSLSFNAALTSMGLYNSLFSERLTFTRPYRKLSGEAQYKREFSSSSVMKSYIGYDLTSVGQEIDGRHLSLKEHNVYANVTHKFSFSKGLSLFTGIANSSVFNDIDNARIAGDRYHNFRNEVHLKTEIRKVCSSSLKMMAGVEDYLRNSSLSYDIYHYHLGYNILAAHVDAQWRIISRLFLHCSARTEMMSSHLKLKEQGDAYANTAGRGTLRMKSHEWLLMPRATLSFIPNNRWQLSFVAGRYSQAAGDDYIAQSGNSMGQSTTDHFILSWQYNTSNTVLRIEPYWKEYHRLPLLVDDTYRPYGYGTSRGVDFFLENHSLVKNLTTTCAYSYNDNQRLYLDDTHFHTPDYASRHNLTLSAKYALGKTIIGLSESFTSGRHFTAGKTPYYNSVDVNLTYLLSPKVIVYTSLNNIFGRTNIFRYDDAGRPVTASRDRFLYIGIFISLKNNKAYDISNF